MTNKDYTNQLSKPRQDDHRKVLIERERMKREKLKQEELESNRRAIRSFYGGANPND